MIEAQRDGILRNHARGRVRASARVSTTRHRHPERLPRVEARAWRKEDDRLSRWRKESGRPNRSVTLCDPTGRGGERGASAVGRLELVGSSWGRDSFATPGNARRSFRHSLQERLCGHPSRRDRRAQSYGNLAIAVEKGTACPPAGPFFFCRSADRREGGFTPGIPSRAAAPGSRPDLRASVCR